MSLRHPSILGFIGWHRASADIPRMFFMEWMPKGALSDVIFSPALARALTDTDKMKIIVGIVLGMRYVHASGLVHSGLRASHVFLSSQFAPKIGGLDCSHFSGYEVQLDALYPDARYLAPECLGDYWFPSADVFSFGILVWEIVQCKPACEASARKSQDVTVERIRKGDRPDTRGMPPKMVQLMAECWRANAGDRPTFSQILDRLQRSHFQFLPKAQSGAIEEYIAPILAWEREHPAPRLEGPDGSDDFDD
jgi:serine/threonine protein kinase